MHPSFYEDQDSQLRSSQRIKILNERPNLTSHSDTILLEDKPTWVDKSRVGEAYQAALPDFSERLPEASMDPDELKWLGTRIWPCAGKKKSRTIQGQIGKGRKDKCSCKNRGSIQCVRLHVSERRLELMRELPPAFFNWSQGNIGEDDVSGSWTADEERRFKALVRLNPLYLQMNLWDKLSQNFPLHGRQKLVSYYFNVFVLRLRSYQNRNSPSNIDSDDEDNSFGFLAL
ncbi:putative SANT/Myb domain-containing protein [Dioscorea sansibarensis]